MWTQQTDKRTGENSRSTIFPFSPAFFFFCFFFWLVSAAASKVVVCAGTEGASPLLNLTFFLSCALPLILVLHQHFWSLTPLPSSSDCCAVSVLAIYVRRDGLVAAHSLPFFENAIHTHTHIRKVRSLNISWEIL